MADGADFLEVLGYVAERSGSVCGASFGESRDAGF
jgi:hypothetical protein